MNDTNMIRSEKLSSSALAYAEFDTDDDDEPSDADDAGAPSRTGTLRVTFHNGQSYTYDGVDQATFEGLVNSSSPGRYWRAVLKGR